MRRVIPVLAAILLAFPACGGGTDKNAGSRSTTPDASASVSDFPPTATSPSDSSTAPATRTMTLQSGKAPFPTYTIQNGNYAGETGQTQALPQSSWAKSGGPWGLIYRTKWVLVPSGLSKAPDHAVGKPDSKVYTDYVVTVRLPKGFTSPSISVLVLSDDSAEVFLNETSLGHQPTGLYVLSGNNSGDPAQFTSEKASLFRPGVNTLRFRVMDVGGGTGLDYSAVITYVP